MRGARRYEDLIVWQLADQMRVLVFALTMRPSFVRDITLHSQTEDAVNSICRNIAEGFGCKHKEFARFLEISPALAQRVARFISNAATQGICHRQGVRTAM